MACCSCCSVAKSCLTLCDPHGLQHANLFCPSVSHWSLLRLMFIESVMPFNQLILYHPLLLPSIFPRIRVQRIGSRIRWPKYWSFSFNISPSNEYLRLISFRIDWFDLLAVQGTLMSLLQHHNLKASVFWCSAFFMVQLSHLYMITGKTIALTIQTFAGKVMSLLFNMLSSFSFFPKKQSSSNFMAVVTTCSDFGVQESKIFYCFHIHLP